MKKELHLKECSLQKLLVLFAFLSLLFACKQSKSTPQETPSSQEGQDSENDTAITLGKPLSLTLFGDAVNMQTRKIEVSNERMSVATGDVVASFEVNGTQKNIPIKVISSPIILKEREYVDVHLLIEAKPSKWKKWEDTISVRRLENEESSLPTIKLEQLKIDGLDVSLANLEELKVQVPYEKKMLDSSDVEAKFSLNDKEEKNVVLEVHPVKLEGKQNARLVISAKNKAKKYKGASYTVLVTKDDPILKLKYLSIYDTDCDISNSSNINISVKKYITNIENSNVSARFDYADKVDEQITVSVTNGSLQVGENAIILSVDASKGRYKRWVQKVKVTRSNTDPQLELKALKIFGRQVFDSKLEVPYKKSNITANDVEALFVYAFESVKELKVNVTDGQLNVGSNQVVLRVPAKPNEYLEWKQTITVTRRKNNIPDPEPQLVELKIDGQTEEIDVSTPSNIVANVKHQKASIRSADITAKFKLNDIFSDVAYKLETKPVEIDEGDVKEIVLKVEAKAGYYKAKSWIINVLRDRPAGNLILKSLKIHNKDVDIDAWTVSVPNTALTVLSTDVKAKFEFNGVIKEYPVIVQDSPVQLEENVEKKIILKIDATNEYSAWKQEVMVTREGSLQNVNRIAELWVEKTG